MKHLRITLLAGLMALALMAPAGASAVPTRVCTGGGTPCAPVYVGPIGFELARTNNVAPEEAYLTVNGVNVRCVTVTENGHGPGGEGSDGMGSITVNPGNPVLGNINSLWFFNCTEMVGGTPCNVTTDAGAPLWPDNIDAVPLAPGSDATLTLNFNTITVNCPGLGTGTSCTYGPGVVQASWYNPGNPARPDTTGPDQAATQFHFANVMLPTASTGCTNGFWRGNYAVRAGGDTTFGVNLWVSSSL